MIDGIRHQVADTKEGTGKAMEDGKHRDDEADERERRAACDPVTDDEDMDFRITGKAWGCLGCVDRGGGTFTKVAAYG